MSEPVNCPHCNKALSVTTVSKLADRSRMAFEVTPHPGEMLNARTVWGTLENLTKMLQSLGKDFGAKTDVLVESAESKDGAIRFNLLVSRIEPGISVRRKNARGIEARSAETSEATARPEGREPGPKDAPESSSGEIVP